VLRNSPIFLTSTEIARKLKKKLVPGDVSAVRDICRALIAKGVVDRCNPTHYGAGDAHTDVQLERRHKNSMTRFERDLENDDFKRKDD